MEIPRFRREYLNPRLTTEDLGNSFQSFVHELLGHDYTDLHLFPGRGKDGCIDLFQEVTDARLVVECKHMEEDGLAEARRRWREVTVKLTKHLADPAGPTKFQAQYGPWYGTTPPIRKFVFCVSSVLQNLEQRDELQHDIAGFFNELGLTYPHLSHLRDLSVKILDWSDLETRLRQRPHLVFRWFPQTRPIGLLPLEESIEYGTFRSYLSSDKLPFYGRGQHLKTVPAPAGVDIADEEELLRLLEDGSVTGLMLTGAGGVGKTRLTLELGRLAQQKGWTVLRAHGRLKEDALTVLGERLTPTARVLLLVDYVETQRDFGELVETLNGLNESYALKVRYAASCRTSYYSTVAAASRHRRVDLSPPSEDRSQSWLRSYREQTVHHILEQSGIRVPEEYLAVCHDIPVLAVFVTYLYSKKRELELAELLKEADFGIWVAKRIQLSFGETVVDRDLAKLMALFPIPTAVLSHPELEKYRVFFDRLATDGWIERLPPDAPQDADMWVTANDVLADQILLSYLQSIPHTADHFASELLSLASDTGCLRSALLTLQRLLDQPLLRSLDWPHLLSQEMGRQPAAWREVRDLLMLTPLLTPLDTIALLGTHAQVWEGAEDETDLQNALGWLARWAVGQEGAALDSPRSSILTQWLEKAARCVTRSNFVLTWGIRFSPEAVRAPALNWIVSRPVVFQTHYLLVAWLESGLPVQDVAEAVSQWAARFRTVPNLSFVLRAWLDAKGELEVVRQHLQAWLAKHATEAEAGFVYKAWLDAKGELEVVRQHLQAWLDKHATEAEASFVYQAWLAAKGELEVVRHHVEAWLAKHATKAEARFVYEAWLAAKGELEVVRQHLQAWLAKHATEAEAQFVYRGWLDAKGELEVVRQHLQAWLAKHATEAEASFVYKGWLDAKGEREVIRHYAEAWLDKHATEAETQFVYRGWLDAKGDVEVVRHHLEAWLDKHATEAEASFVYRGWLHAKGELEVIRHHLEAWLAEHATDADADFVFRAWLEAGGPFSVISSPAIQWLTQNRDKAEAVYLMKFLAKQENIPGGTVKDILHWCSKFTADDDALWRLTQLGNHLLNEQVAKEVCAASEAVLGPRLSGCIPLPPATKGLITTLLSYLVRARNLQSGELRSRVDALLLTWLRNPASFGTEPKPHPLIQRKSYVQRVVDLLVSGALDLSSDREALKRFLHWVSTWEGDWKSKVRGTLVWLTYNYPAPDLWEIVEFD
jgi:hypothetical protein